MTFDFPENHLLLRSDESGSTIPEQEKYTPGTRFIRTETTKLTGTIPAFLNPKRTQLFHIVGESGEKWIFVFTLALEKNKKVAQLHGEYECKLDAKGRLIIPAALKKQLPKAAKNNLFINRGFEKCCVLYPANEWSLIATEINKLSDYIKKEREFKRYFLRGASQLTMDAASRILIPKPQLEYAGIKTEVMLLAYGNKIELWSKVAYEKMLREEPADFSALAEDVMTHKERRSDG